MWADKLALSTVAILIVVVMVTNPSSEVNTWAFWHPQLWPFLRLFLILWVPLRIIDLAFAGPRRRSDDQTLFAAWRARGATHPKDKGPEAAALRKAMDAEYRKEGFYRP